MSCASLWKNSCSRNDPGATSGSTAVPQYLARGKTAAEACTTSASTKTATINRFTRLFHTFFVAQISKSAVSGVTNPQGACQPALLGNSHCTADLEIGVPSATAAAQLNDTKGLFPVCRDAPQWFSSRQPCRFVKYPGSAGVALANARCATSLQSVE